MKTLKKIITILALSALLGSNSGCEEVKYTKAVYKEAQTNLYPQRYPEKQGNLEQSLSNYVVEIAGNLVPITRENLYLFDYEPFQTKNGYEDAQQLSRNLPDHPRPLLLFNGTLHDITPSNLYVGFDGLGYMSCTQKENE